MSDFEKWLAKNDTGAALVKMALMECRHDQRGMLMAAMEVVFGAGRVSGGKEMGKQLLQSQKRKVPA
jgi:hypothetical protein